MGSNPASRTRPLADRFERKVIRADDPDACWGWRGSTNLHGYGRITLGSRGDGVIGAHRASWIIHHGDIPEGLYVLHKCDNPICTNPRHLALGTQSENIREAIARGRRPARLGFAAPRQH